MLDIFAQYATNDKLENEGVWIPFGEQSKLLIARAGNRKYTRLLSQAVDKNQKLLDQKNDEADKLSDQIMIDVLAETILLGWEDVAWVGEKLEYNKENVRKVLAVKDFRTEVVRLSNDINHFRMQKEEEAVKN